jgi:LmbE family N-acetylglucosaminyl deacetylase
MKKKCIVVFGAHNDDQLIGAGGTIRKFVNEGGIVYTYIFSYGETSHPHLKPHIIAKTRTKEAEEAADILGEKLNFFGLKEGTFLKTADVNMIAKIIKEKKPEKVFTHAPDDPHPDHRAVYKITKEAAKKARYYNNLYAYDIWNIFSFKTRNYPKLFIDISDTFHTKLKAMAKHKSQWSSIILLGWNFYLKAIWHGWNNKCKYAELFHKIEVK